MPGDNARIRLGGRLWHSTLPVEEAKVFEAEVRRQLTRWEVEHNVSIAFEFNNFPKPDP
jgi:hypothetical protein